jgi:hypothetical protein
MNLKKAILENLKKLLQFLQRMLIINKRANGGVAQLGERTVRIRKVKGSNPSVSTIS